MVNRNEQSVVDKYVAAGWRALRGGAPDFVFFKTDEKGVITEDHGVRYKVEVVLNDHPTQTTEV